MIEGRSFWNKEESKDKYMDMYKCLFLISSECLIFAKK